MMATVRKKGERKGKEAGVQGRLIKEVWGRIDEGEVGPSSQHREADELSCSVVTTDPLVVSISLCRSNWWWGKEDCGTAVDLTGET